MFVSRNMAQHLVNIHKRCLGEGRIYVGMRRVVSHHLCDLPIDSRQMRRTVHSGGSFRLEEITIKLAVRLDTKHLWTERSERPCAADPKSEKNVSRRPRLLLRGRLARKRWRLAHTRVERHRARIGRSSCEYLSCDRMLIGNVGH